MQVTLLRLVMAIALSGFALGAPGSYAADETAALKEQVSQLNERIAQLEKQLGQRAPAQAQAPAAAQPADAYDPMWQSGYVSQWDPFAEMEMMQRQMHRVMGSVREDALLNPNVDIKESPKEYTITMDIPGMDKNNIDVKVEGRSLIVSGERSINQEEKDKGKVIHRERSFSHFMRAVPLPADAKTDVVDADYKNGVLNVRVGRNAPASKPAPQKIPVK